MVGTMKKVGGVLGRVDTIESSLDTKHLSFSE